MNSPDQRAVIDGLLTENECRLLIHMARCCSAVGYRDNCCAVTSTVIARINPHFLPFFIEVRERIRDAVETSLGLDLSLLIEFTGLISWRPGASIGWHRDNNRNYLTQRHAAAVIYLNQGNKDFQGGVFRFQAPSPECEKKGPIDVLAVPGRGVIYSTLEEHCVDPPVYSGERFTLAMWFTTDPAFDEDRKLLEVLRETTAAAGEVFCPLPAAMHALPGPDSGVDMRLCRLACYGIGFAREGDINQDGHIVVLKELEDGEWEKEQALRVVVNGNLASLWLKKGGIHSKKYQEQQTQQIGTLSCEPGSFSIGSPMRMSVGQAVCAVQWGLTCLDPGLEGLLPGEGLLSSWNEVRCCEQVCARHLNGSGLEEDAESCSCEWLGRSLPVAMCQEGFEGCTASLVRGLVEETMARYIATREQELEDRWDKFSLGFKGIRSMEQQPEQPFTEEENDQLLAVIGAEEYEQLVRAHEDFIMQVEDLKKLGAGVFDSVKTQWVGKLDALIQESSSHCSDTAAQWQQAAGSILEARERLENVRKIVGTLAMSIGQRMPSA